MVAKVVDVVDILVPDQRANRDEMNPGWKAPRSWWEAPSQSSHSPSRHGDLEATLIANPPQETAAFGSHQINVLTKEKQGSVIKWQLPRRQGFAFKIFFQQFVCPFLGFFQR